MENKKLILIVDDEQEVLEAMRDILESKGFDVLVAMNGVEGLKILKEKPVSAVILDLNMPRMDGYMFLEHLKERWEKEHRSFSFPKILILTAVDKGTDLGLAHNLGAAKFMNKPFKSTEFIAAVNEMLA